jgi:hypothetical protein
MALPGNITFNGQKIWDEADAEIKRIEELTTGSYSLPVYDMIG